MWAESWSCFVKPAFLNCELFSSRSHETEKQHILTIQNLKTRECSAFILALSLCLYCERLLWIHTYTYIHTQIFSFVVLYQVCSMRINEIFTPKCFRVWRSLATGTCHLDSRVWWCIHLLSVFPTANAISDGDKESECDEDGPSPEDSRKVKIPKFSNMLRNKDTQVKQHALYWHLYDCNLRK